jgi:hypothetical protein
MIIAQDKGDSASRRPGSNAQEIISLSPSDGERDEGRGDKECSACNKRTRGVGFKLVELKMSNLRNKQPRDFRCSIDRPVLFNHS